MKKNQDGFVGVVIVIFFFLMLFAAFFVRFKTSNEVVSGIVYNTTNDRFISGATRFSVRASEATYTSEENRSTYCLPPNSPHKELVNRAAKDKRIKVEVEAKKYFAIQAPWTCKDNVTVKEIQ
jgi:hypothetical protein